LARLLVSHGSGYTSKFAAKSGGFIIMANKLKRFWANPRLWPICLSILFGYDVANITLDRGNDNSSLLTIFSKRKVSYPESLVIITSMLQLGLKDVMKHEGDSDSQAKDSNTNDAEVKIPDSTALLKHRGKCVHVTRARGAMNLLVKQRRPLMDWKAPCLEPTFYLGQYGF
jgi:hypothetical protein